MIAGGGAQSTITALIMPKERGTEGGTEGGRERGWWARVCSACCYEIGGLSMVRPSVRRPSFIRGLCAIRSTDVDFDGANANSFGVLVVG